MWEAAIPSLLGATLRIRTRRFAGRVEPGCVSAELIPLGCAAKDVNETDRLAARLVLAPRSVVGFTATARTLVPASVLVTFAAKSGVGPFDTGGIPRRGAAERIHSTHGCAAGTVGACGCFMHLVAAIQADIAAIRHVLAADYAGAVHASLVPTNLAAVLERFIRADLLAAVADCAARRVVKIETVSTDDLSTSAVAGFTSCQHAG